MTKLKNTTTNTLLVVGIPTIIGGILGYRIGKQNFQNGYGAAALMGAALGLIIGTGIGTLIIEPQNSLSINSYNSKKIF